MPTSAQIELQDTGTLTALEIERVREIAGVKTSSEISSLISGFTSVENQATRADIVAWDEIGDGTVRLKGNRDGVDYSQERDRNDIRMRIRLRLGLDPINPDFDPGAGRLIWLETPWIADAASEE